MLLAIIFRSSNTNFNEAISFTKEDGNARGDAMDGGVCLEVLEMIDDAGEMVLLGDALDRLDGDDGWDWLLFNHTWDWPRYKFASHSVC